MASQRTHREFASGVVAGKVHVPWDTKCLRETARRGLLVRGEAYIGAAVRTSQAYHERLAESRPYGAPSLQASLTSQISRWLSMQRSSNTIQVFYVLMGWSVNGVVLAAAVAI